MGSPLTLSLINPKVPNVSTLLTLFLDENRYTVCEPQKSVCLESQALYIRIVGRGAHPGSPGSERVQKPLTSLLGLDRTRAHTAFVGASLMVWKHLVKVEF